MSWFVEFNYCNGSKTTVTNETYNDDKITFLQLKQKMINKKNSYKFIYDKREIKNDIQIKEYNDKCVDIVKITKVYNKIMGLTNQTPSIDLNNQNIIKIIYTHNSVYVALTSYGNVISWHYESNNTLNTAYNSVKDYLFNIIDIQNTEYAFAALKSDYTVITWGHEKFGGDSSLVQKKLVNVVELFSNDNSFVALKMDNTIVTWGDCSFECINGSLNDIYFKKNTININPVINIKTIFNTNSAFAALTYDKTVITWGHDNYGGNSVLIKDKLINIKTIYSTCFAFAALKYDGVVISWGDDGYDIYKKDLFDIKTISCTNKLFIALKNNNSLVIWGSVSDINPYDTNNDVYIKLPPNIGPISQILANNYNFIVLCENNDVFDVDPGTHTYTQTNTLTNIKTIYKTSHAFAVLKNDQTVYTCGNSACGGDSSEVQKHLTNITHIVSTAHSFAAIKDDDTVVVWGCNHGNTHLSDVYTNVEKIFCTKNTIFLVNEF